MIKLRTLLNEIALKNLVKIESYFDEDDEYAEDLDQRLDDANVDWERESKITLLDPNKIKASEWNSSDDDPNDPKVIRMTKTDPSKFPPILAVKKGSGYEVIDGIHRVHAFRIIGYLIPAIVISQKLEFELATHDTKMVDFMNSKYQNSNIPTTKKIK